jgi:membrane peptidoglycan carboxypeptidase
MREVVAEGTAQLAQVKGYELGGKTGTAQAKIKVGGEIRKDLKCWFYCYGPAGVKDTPRYVTCIVVEGGVWGGTTTAPIAQEIMSRLFAMDKGATESIAFLQPALGNFNGLGAVDMASNPNSSNAPMTTGTITSTGTLTTAPSPAAAEDAAGNGDITGNNDASAVAPAADAPPGAIRGSNSKHR